MSTHPKIHAIADEPPQFPCFLWNTDPNTPQGEPRWERVTRAEWEWNAGPETKFWTHWSPDAPTPPTVPPDAQQPTDEATGTPRTDARQLERELATAQTELKQLKHFYDLNIVSWKELSAKYTAACGELATLRQQLRTAEEGKKQ